CSPQRRAPRAHRVDRRHRRARCRHHHHTLRRQPGAVMTVTAAPLTDALLGLDRRAPMETVRGEGVRVYDADGRAWLDFAAGIAVNALGYNDAGVRRAMIEALDTGLIHVSNLFRTEPGERLADKLVAASFADHVFFCNSGAE